jgi:hypothetical protein
MDLWIRSQDKTRLVKINSLEYSEYQDIHSINGYYTNEVDNYDLGIYKSKERALEVLDEIQSKIARLNYQNHFLNKDFNLIESNVYQMPEE